jgi:uncharacterized protein
MARSYRNYSDLDAVFAANPVTRDISLRRDEAAVKFAIKNLVLTRNFERPFDSSIGSQLNRFLFEPIDDTTIILMKQVISNAITNHEPRVTLLGINIDASPDENKVTVNINFKIKNTEKPFNISFALDRTR